MGEKKYNFIDIHTHSPQKEILSIISLYKLDTPPKNQYNHFYSVGLHPWYLNSSSWQEAQTKLQTALKWDGVIAFGEIGLDRVRGAEFSKQIEYFQNQLQLFKNSSFKVCFIHCVRAWSDLLPCITPMNDKVFILHDFNSSLAEFKRMVQVPHLYFSLGQNFMRPQSRLHQFLDQIPRDRIFFETDDSDTPIAEIYQSYLNACEAPLEVAQLKEIIDKNYRLLFR